MVKEILREAHQEFEVFYRRWCAERDIDLAELNKKNQKKVDAAFQKPQSKGIIPTDTPKKKQDKHKDIYKSLAKRFTLTNLTLAIPTIGETIWISKMPLLPCRTTTGENYLK